MGLGQAYNLLLLASFYLQFLARGHMEPLGQTKPFQVLLNTIQLWTGWGLE